jgi:tetratricopeptide (TPR) repeat protein
MAFHKAKALQEAERSVAQGKIAQAIKQYQDILDNDPSDVSLLNTVGDLYIRERNITEGLRQFHRLAEAYVREGFNVKAIAIYRKISKVDPNSVDTKLAELYQLQGLSREAREQYLQAAEFFKKRNQTERALEVLRKLVLLDPENTIFRDRLAAECEQTGKREDAAQAHLESAEILLRRDDQVAAETALKKAAELDPKNSRIQILRARVALTRHEPEEAEKIINSLPELQLDPAGKRILLDSYLGARKLPEAEKLVLEVFEATPSDFAPVSSVSALLVEKGNIDEAYQLLAGLAEQMINQNNAPPLLESLRRIWNKAPKHIPTLELMHRVCERSADELTLPEVLEALGRAYEEAGDLEKTEVAYLKLIEREPENENYRGLLNAIQQKLGRNIKPVDFSAREMALAEEEELPPEPASVDADQEAMVKEALDNSDLFARYNLPEKAIVELEKALQRYPDQIEVHQRILEISRKSFPERGAEAAAQLARIFAKHGDHETASKYQAIATAKSPLQDIPVPSPPPSEKVKGPAAPPPAAPEIPQTGMTAEFRAPAFAPEAPVAAAAAPPPQEVPFDLTPPEVSSEPPAPHPAPPAPAEQTMELDLSGELEAMAAVGFEAPASSVPEPVALLPVEIPLPEAIPPSAEKSTPPPVVEPPVPVVEPPAPVVKAPVPVVETPPPPVEAPTEVPELLPAPAEEAIPADLEDGRIEVDFYLENGFVDEARQALAALEGKYPDSPLVAELRQRLNERAAKAPSAELPAIAEQADEAVVADQPEEFELVDVAPLTESPTEVVQAEPEAVPPTEPKFMAEEPAPEEWELPTSYAVIPEPESDIDPVVPAPVTEPETPPPVAEVVLPPPAHEPEIEEPVTAEGSGMDMMGHLAGDFAATLEGMTVPAYAPPAASAPSPMAEANLPPGSGQGMAQLSSLLAEMEGPGGSAAQAAKDDPETHYNLGVAFREMGLLDEAIGEFQKVVKIAGKGNFPPNFLPVCSLLAICFMEKKMPGIAVKWYVRALETPDLDEEAQMALQYDLGVAYEQAGDSRRALERFTEVYSQNIDFRDVADKVRDLQQKA